MPVVEEAEMVLLLIPHYYARLAYHYRLQDNFEDGQRKRCGGALQFYREVPLR
jgi:hypothetical protein